MLRILIVLTLCIWPAIAQAQMQVSVRTGEHDGYSRIVFDWGKSVAYSVQKSGNAITVSFNAAGSLPSSLSARAILGVKTVSTDPLVITLDTAEGLRRDFATANRIILDLNASGAVTASQPKAAEAPKKEEAINQPEPKKETAPEPAKVEAPAKETSVEPDQSQLNPVDDKAIPEELKAVAARLGLEPEHPHLQIAEMQEADEPQQPEPAKDNAANSGDENKKEPSKLAQKMGEEEQANLFTLSSTKAMGLAVFEYAGNLNIMTNRSDVAVRPQVTGPNADYFTPIGQVNMDKGTLFLAPRLDGTNTRAKGAGLLWNVIVSPRIDDRKPIQPERVGVPEKGDMRGGSLLWPMKTATGVITLKHPQTSENLIVVPVDRADDFAGPAMDFIDFEVLSSPVGIAIRPKIDDLQVIVTPQGVMVSRPDGLAISPQKNLLAAKENKKKVFMPGNPDANRIFNFMEWEMGGLDALNENRNVIISGMQDMSDDARIEGLITLAKMNLASGRGAESLGFLNYAEQQLPELNQNPEFLALRGAAKAFDWKTDWALADFASKALDAYPEMGLWKAFVLADLGDWQQAHDVLPQDLSVLRSYPPQIRNRLGIVLAEVYLRAGDLKPAEDLFNLVEEGHDDLNTELDAALKYLKGEYFRQKKDIKKTIEFWEPLTEGKDDLYRVKAGLALSRLLVDEGKLKPKQAIDTLERLRYAWRGDELEAQVNYWLGRTYFEAGEYIKGMKILRGAAELVPNTELGRRILNDMQSLFTNFFLDEGLAKVSPMDAVSLFEEFNELVPPGEEGNKVIAALAEHLVKTDLLTRAGNLLQHQLDHRLSGEKALRTAMRLAAIRLIDGKPEQADEALKRATSAEEALPAEQKSTKVQQDLALLRARALSQEKRTDEALDILEDLPRSKNVNRLRADIAWQAGQWSDASFALEDVIVDENISLTRPLSDAHAMLILQQATAMNLSSDRIGLANMREKYGELMSQTNKGRLFDVITRPRQNAGLADRETLLSNVSETDLFGDFLNSYKDVDMDKTEEKKPEAKK